ncbi:hypothetical protein RHGRI_033435 [Rhododendron griersonianum]|uniref:Uncharacterized protein n=1 Tax=Rhododendron griersonianum TaxID=479676 RepID=A0AAV6I2G3_9ERIC|nr:hypothetical protein RHGRI_033435 [Rhododendron griersonianum]
MAVYMKNFKSFFKNQISKHDNNVKKQKQAYRVIKTWGDSESEKGDNNKDKENYMTFVASLNSCEDSESSDNELEEEESIGDLETLKAEYNDLYSKSIKVTGAAYFQFLGERGCLEGGIISEGRETTPAAVEGHEGVELVLLVVWLRRDGSGVMLLMFLLLMLLLKLLFFSCCESVGVDAAWPVHAVKKLIPEVLVLSRGSDVVRGN